MSPLTQDRSVAEQEAKSKTRLLAWLAIVFGLVAIAGLLLALLRRWRLAKRLPARPQPLPPRPQAVLDLQGLTEEEAAARRLEGQDNARRTGSVVHFKPPYTTRQIWRANTLTIFNLSMVGLAVVQVLLGKSFDALLTTLVMFLGIGLNAGQQLWASSRLKTLERTTRSQATIVRESRQGTQHGFRLQHLVDQKIHIFDRRAISTHNGSCEVLPVAMYINLAEPDSHPRPKSVGNSSFASIIPQSNA